MAKDYKSFASAAKSRFRKMAVEFGYEQVTGTRYLKERDGWYEGFSLQASSYGNDFFYINYGVSVANVWEPFLNEVDKKGMGYWLSNRLHDEHDQGFPNGTKVEIEASVDVAIEKYKEQALPWFCKINGLIDIAEMYLDSTNLKASLIGQHETYLGLHAANYGLLLFKAGKFEESEKWLEESDRLYSLDDDLEDYEIEQHKTIRKLIEHLKNA